MAKTEAPASAPAAAPAAEQASPASGGKQVLLTGVLLLGLMVGSSSAAVLAASLLLKPAPAAQAAEGEGGDAAAAAGSEAAAAPADAAKGDKAAAGARIQVAFKDPIIVNVYRTNQRRLLSCQPVFVVSSEAAKKTLEDRMVDLQDLLIGVLKGKTLEQLDDPGVTSEVAREITELVNNKFELGSGVIEVKFSQFVVQ